MKVMYQLGVSIIFTATESKLIISELVSQVTLYKMSNLSREASFY